MRCRTQQDERLEERRRSSFPSITDVCGGWKDRSPLEGEPVEERDAIHNVQARKLSLSPTSLIRERETGSSGMSLSRWRCSLPRHASRFIYLSSNAVAPAYDGNKKFSHIGTNTQHPPQRGQLTWSGVIYAVLPTHNVYKKRTSRTW